MLNASARSRFGELEERPRLHRSARREGAPAGKL